MRNALRQRESDVQYREVTEHFARLDIHPGYLAEFEPSSRRPGDSLASDSILHAAPHFAPVSRTGYQPMDYVAFGLSFLGLILSLITSLLYFNREEIAEPPKVEIQYRQSDPRILRLDESVRQLGLALATVISRIEQQPGSTIAPLGPLLEVIAPKANLRIAPRRDASAVMAISAGTRLLVHDQLDDWFQVYAPSGELLWISESATGKVAMDGEGHAPIQ